MVANEMSYKKKILNFNDLKLIKKHYIKFKLPMEIKKKFKENEINKITNFMKKDKKNLNNKINLILLKKIGQTTKPNSINVSRNEIQRFLISNYN